MPVLRVTCPENALTAEQKAHLAPLLLEAVMRQEVDPVTDEGRRATFIMFNEIPLQNCFLSKEPFWLVERFIAAGFCTQARRDAAQTAITKAFTSVLGAATFATWAMTDYHRRPTGAPHPPYAAARRVVWCAGGEIGWSAAASDLAGRGRRRLT